METLLALCLGIGLSAATGLRVFLPPCVVGLAASQGMVSLPPSAEWMAEPLSITVFAIAAGVEILAYTIPLVDNALDTVAGPAAVVAGILLTASFLQETSPLLRWSLAVVAGGGAAATTQTLSTAMRASSTVTTVGVANPLVSLGEAVSSAVVAVLSAVVPIAVAVLVVLLAVVTLGRIRGLRRRRSTPARTQ